MTVVDKATGKTLVAGDPCPSCGAELVTRTINRSKNPAKIGSQFLGCSAFPRCRRAFKPTNGDAPVGNDNDGDGDDDKWTEAERPNVTPRTTNRLPNDDAALDLAEVLQRILSRPTVDKAQVEAICRAIVDDTLDGINDSLADAVKEAIANAPGSKVTIEVRDRTADVVRSKPDVHMYVPRLVRLLDAGIHVFLWGAPGTGKTTGAMHAAELLGRQFEIDTLDPSTQRSQVQGFQTPNLATGGTTPAHTSFTRCWTEGKLYIADELDSSPGHVQNLFNSALANGHAPLAWGNVERPKGFLFCGTGNTPGCRTSAFPDRHNMSGAFKDRLYFMHWPLDPAIEMREGGRKVARPEPRTPRPIDAGAWVNFVTDVREWAERNAPTLHVTPRASIVGKIALAAGEAVEDVADGLIFRGCDAELRSKVLANVRMP
jgi:hypothetical protein